MRIEYNKHDQNYPYIIHGGWGDKVYCDLEDLRNLKNEINKILKEKNKKSVDKPTK